MEPDYELWELADAGKLDLKFTLPIYSHSDEGRTLKKKRFGFFHAMVHLAPAQRNMSRMCRPPNISRMMRCGLISAETLGARSSWCL